MPRRGLFSLSPIRNALLGGAAEHELLLPTWDVYGPADSQLFLFHAELLGNFPILNPTPVGERWKTPAPWRLGQTPNACLLESRGHFQVATGPARRYFRTLLRNPPSSESMVMKMPRCAPPPPPPIRRRHKNLLKQDTNVPKSLFDLSQPPPRCFCIRFATKPDRQEASPVGISDTRSCSWRRGARRGPQRPRPSIQTNCPQTGRHDSRGLGLVVRSVRGNSS